MSALPFHLAAFDGDTDAVNQFLAQGADVQALTDQNETPLLFAVTGGHVATVRTLLKYGADVNLLPEEGSSPLRRAIHGGHAEIVRLLLDRGADPNGESPPKPETPEEKATMREKFRAMWKKTRRNLTAFGIEPEDDDESVEQLLDSDDEIPEPKIDPVPGELRCLMLAIKSGDPATVKVLLDAGYPPNATRQSPVCPLDFAQFCSQGLEIPRLLLQYGADPNGNGPISSLLNAVMKGDIPYIELLLEAGARTDAGPMKMGPLSFALNLGKSKMADFLIERSIGLDDPMLDIFLRGNSDTKFAERIAAKRGTAWLSRVKAGDVEGVRDALKNGANLHAKDKDQESALTIAIRNKDVAMVRVLLESGCEMELDNDYGVTALHRAARAGSSEIIEILLGIGAEVGAVNMFGRTPLLDAAVNGHVAAADRLIAAGAVPGVAEAILLKRLDVADALWQSGTPTNFADDSGMTALHAAASLGDRDLAEELLDRGADITAVDRTGDTVLRYAIQSENEALVSLLIERGAELRGTSAKESSPLYIAAVLLRSAPITRLLLERGASLAQPVSEDVVSRIEKAVAEEGGDPDVARRSVERIKERSSLVDSLLMFQRALRDNEELRASPSDGKWRQTDRLWGVLQALFDFGAEVNGTDSEGNTILCSLIEFDAPLTLIQTAIAKGARVNPSDRERQAPLTLAVERGRADVAGLLLDAGANPNGGLSPQSPLEVARAAGRTDLVDLLTEKGASDGIRQAMVADLGDDAHFIFRTPPPTDGSPIPVFSLNTAALNEKMKEERAAKIAERRERLVREINENTN